MCNIFPFSSSKQIAPSYSVTVIFLDDTERIFDLESHSTGAHLLEQVYHHLGLCETDYFGVQYSTKHDFSPKSYCIEDMLWLNPCKTIPDHVRKYQCPLVFRVKIYIPDPTKLQEERTLHQFYLQVLKDFRTGKLQLQDDTACLLASYVLQAKLGDYPLGRKFLASVQLFPNQSKDMERQILQFHKTHRGQLPPEAELNFLDHAMRTAMYGVESYNVKDSEGKNLQLGVSARGIVVLENKLRVDTFQWFGIDSVSFRGKRFYVKFLQQASGRRARYMTFNLNSRKVAKALLKACIVQHQFFITKSHAKKLKLAV